MFDIGFWELVVIGVVALLVIGPDRLPGLARTAGLWIGRARNFIGTVKADIDRELQADELRRALERDAGVDELKQIMNSTRDSLERDARQDYLVKAVEDERATGADAADTPDSADTAEVDRELARLSDEVPEKNNEDAPAPAAARDSEADGRRH